MSLIEGTLSLDETKKIKQFIDNALSTFQEIDDRRGALNDFCKVIAEELGIKPAILMKAAKSVAKQSLENDKETMETIIELLVAAGRA